MFRPVPLWLFLLCLILGIFGTIGFGALVLHAARGGKKFEPVQDVAVAIADTPLILADVFRWTDVFAASPGTEALPPGWWDNPADSFRDPGYVLLTLYDSSARQSFVRLMRLSDGRVLRDYRPDIGALTREADRTWTPTQDDRRIPFAIGHPDLLPDGGLIFSGRSLMARIGACGDIRWMRPGFHHSIERDLQGNYWTPSVALSPPRPDVRPTFREDGVTLIDPNGRTLFDRSSSEIFAANGLEYLVRGRPYTDDPYHLNDVQPVYSDGPYWQRGDVFLSYRHQSLVMLYRPSSGRVLWWRAGPWLSQHDVTILDDHRIGLFDNRVVQGVANSSSVGYNRFIIYDFATNRWSSPYNAGFRQWNLRTVAGGRATPFANGDIMAEDSMGGQLVRMDVQGRMRWRFVHGDAQGGRYRLALARYLDPAEYRAAIAAAIGTRCQ
jgi:Arylsulfotransferase (ASST)